MFDSASNVSAATAASHEPDFENSVPDPRREPEEKAAEDGSFEEDAKHPELEPEPQKNMDLLGLEEEEDGRASAMVAAPQPQKTGGADTKKTKEEDLYEMFFEGSGSKPNGGQEQVKGNKKATLIDID